MIGPLLKTRNGHDAIVAIVDCLTKAVHLIPTTVELTAEALAKLYRDMIWKLHGLQKRIISDCGLQFAAKFMKSLCNSLGITRNLSTAYHPQTDGQTEHSHQETEAFLRNFINNMQDDWDDWLAIIEFQYNDKMHYTTRQTPFFLNNGYHPWKGEIILDDENPSAEDFLK